MVQRLMPAASEVCSESEPVYSTWSAVCQRLLLPALSGMAYSEDLSKYLNNLAKTKKKRKSLKP
jgi:hypothetical protein